MGARSAIRAAAADVFNPCDFAFRKPIILNPAQISGNLTNFPLLISLINPDLRDKARADGYDIVFTASDGTTQLAHEIEHFDGATGRLVAWVKMPGLSATANIILYMYYGNSTITSPTQNPSQVWDANYAGVWHLTERGNGTVGEYRDSSQFGNNGQGGQGNALYVPTRVVGQIGYGQAFNNADGQYNLIDVGNATSLDISGNQITLEAWIRLSANPQSGKWYGVLNHKGYFNGYRLIIPGNNPAPNNLALSFQLPGQTNDLQTAKNVTAGTWQHIVADYDGATMRVYVDGVQDANTLNKSNNITAASPENHVWIGYGDQPTNFAGSYEWVGQIDEVRISNVARSTDWIRTEYNNQSSPASFYRVGPETPESVFCSMRPTKTPTPQSTRTPTSTATATSTATSAAKPTRTALPTLTRTPTSLPTNTATATPVGATATATLPQPSPTAGVSASATSTATRIATDTRTPTATPTATKAATTLSYSWLPLIARPYPCAPPQATWQGGQPSGVIVDTLLVGPKRDGKVIYAGAANAPGIYVSRDGGITWPEVSALPPVLSLVANPTVTTTIYAGTLVGGIYQSANEGATWSQLNSPPNTIIWSLAAISTSSSSFTLYAGTANGIYFSQPPFTNWTAAGGPIVGNIVYAIVNDVENGNLYAATSVNGVYQSVDGGGSWTQTALTGISALSLAIGPSNALYAGTSGQGVYVSTNGGSSWAQLNAGMGNQSVYALVLDPLNTQTLFAGTIGGGVFVSNNGAAAWAPYNTGLSQSNVYALAFDARCYGTLFAGTANGVWRSDTRSAPSSN